MRRTRPEPLVPTSVVSRQASELRAAMTAREARRTPARNPVSWFVRLVIEVIHKADRDRMLGLAAETAFFAVLSLFPALLVVAAVLGQLSIIIGTGNADRVEQSVLDFLDTVLTDQASGAVATVRGLFDSSPNTLTLASLLAVISLSTAFSTLINTVNITYDVPETRGWWRRRWLGLLLGVGTVLTGAVAVTLLVVGPLFAAADIVSAVGLTREYDYLWRYVRWPVAFLALVLWATTMGYLAPARRTRWRHNLPGGLLTALLWLAASYGLNIYLSLVVTASPIFGALGGGLILMIWFYLLCVALLSGAELNAILLARRRRRALLQVGADSEDEDAPAPLVDAPGRDEPVDVDTAAGRVRPAPAVDGDSPDQDTREPDSDERNTDEPDSRTLDSREPEELEPDSHQPVSRAPSSRETGSGETGSGGRTGDQRAGRAAADERRADGSPLRSGQPEGAAAMLPAEPALSFQEPAEAAAHPSTRRTPA